MSRSPSRVTRRRALELGAAASAVPLLGAATGRAWGQAVPPAAPVPGIRKPQPAALLTARGTNAEMRWSAMEGAGYLTPVDRFFVRNHTTTPLIDPATWRLRVFGSGLRGRPERAGALTFSLRDLERLPAASVTAFVECAGNGRSGFARQQGTPAKGTAWELGAIGVARWLGVPLREVLERAGVRPRAVDVMPEGLDDPVRGDDGSDLGHVRRPLPVDVALDDALIALEMNGRTLPADHGFPARLIVPGWIGVANIKWLGAIEVADEPLFSAWNTTQYRFTGGSYPADAKPLRRQQRKAAFELDQGAQLRAGQPVTLTGRAWSGRSVPERVDVSTDGGASWERARLRGPDKRQAWVRFEHPWTPAVPGPGTLLARVTDRDGTVQPSSVPFNANGYLFSAVWRHPVTVV